jgi:hypothetical protein
MICSCGKKSPIAFLLNSKTVLDTVLVGQTKTGTVTIKNIGTDTLKIEGVKCSCECTVPEIINASAIAPNDSLNLKITVKAYSDDIGKWKKVLCTFKTNADSIFLRHYTFFYTKNVG